MNSKVLATTFKWSKLGCNDFADNKVWWSYFNMLDCRGVLIHYHNNIDGGKEADLCQNLTELNTVKSELLNLRFKMNWDSFNECIDIVNNSKVYYNGMWRSNETD